MKRTPFSETKIVAIQKHANAGIKVKDLGHKRQIGDATYLYFINKRRCF